LESDRSGIELRNSRVDHNGVMHATVFIPDGKVGPFVSKFEAYADPAKDSPKGKPKNNDLVGSITQIRLAAQESFWMEAGEFPKEKDQPLWWEVWLRDATRRRTTLSQPSKMHFITLAAFRKSWSSTI